MAILNTKKKNCRANMPKEKASERIYEYQQPQQTHNDDGDAATVAAAAANATDAASRKPMQPE
jgi:hypothetical protein